MGSLSAWLDDIKEGWGARFQPAFAEIGVEDVEDLKVFDAACCQRLGTALSAVGARWVQCKRILDAVDAASGGQALGASEGGAGGAAAMPPASAVVATLTEKLVGKLDQVKELEERLAELEVGGNRIFTITHYNILGKQYGHNLEPWFLYPGSAPKVTPEQRKRVMFRHDEKGPDGKYKNKGFDAWVEGVLTAEQIAEIKRVDTEHFSWEKRKHKLVAEMLAAAPDVVTLVELDPFKEFFEAQLRDRGYDSVFQKRPRDKSHDGCCIAWRRRMFALVASRGESLSDCADRADRRDRTVLFALLRFRHGRHRHNPNIRLHWHYRQVERAAAAADEEEEGEGKAGIDDDGPPVHSRILVVSTHLAKSPDDAKQTMVRAREFAQLFGMLREFAKTHDALEVPVVLAGDMNCVDMSTLAGSARALAWFSAEPAHSLLYDHKHAPTGVTSITDDRKVRIDYILFSASTLELAGMGDTPPTSHHGGPIPDLHNPSDHFPVTARFSLKLHWKKHRENAYAWLSCVAKSDAALPPLSSSELKSAFVFFDQNGSGYVSGHELHLGCANLSFHLTRDEIVAVLEKCGHKHKLVRRRASTKQGSCAAGAPPETSVLHLASADSSSSVDLTVDSACLRTGTTSYPLHQQETKDGGDGADDGDANAAERVIAAVQIEYSDFVVAYMKGIADSKSTFIRDIEKAFAIFDIDSDETITKAELFESIRQLAPMPMDEGRIEKVFDEMDTDHDGVVSPTEFSSWLCKAQCDEAIGHAEAHETRTHASTTFTHT